MSEATKKLQHGVLALDYDLEARIAQWESLRGQMIRAVPSEFTRDEWAYLVTFISRDSLRDVFERSLGPPATGVPQSFFRPRGPVAIWLPNNVSLLGPLVLVLASFAGVPLRVKAGSRSDDLCEAFVRYAIEHLGDGELRSHLRDRVTIQRFDRHDPRNAAMAADAAVRIAFGSNAAVAAIHALPHSIDSVGIGFGDHRSEAWVEACALNDSLVTTLAKIFAIYGQAGCTSPRRVVVLEGTRSDCVSLRDRIVELWPSVIRQDVPMHVASQNVLHAQLNAADGWDVRMAPRHAAVLGVGPVARTEMSGLMSLAIVPGSLDEAIATLPPNIQTIGSGLLHPGHLLPRIAHTKVKRFVPLAKMHHFGPIWDGQNFFQNLFEEITLT
jgi:hypothetical protein